MDADERGTEQQRRALIAGIALWLAFGVLAVWLRGVRWEESYERAQALLGLTPYPDGHPLYRYAHDALTVQYYLSAAILRSLPGPLAVCTFRNVLFLWATTLPVFLMTFLISRKVVFAHVAAVVTLMGVLQPLASYYPLFVWPTRFSSGHIGMGFILLVLCLLAADRLRLGFFLLGLSPCIHIGQTPVLFTVAGLLSIGMLRNEERRGRLIKACLWGCFGVFASVGVWLAVRAGSLPAPTTGPYFFNADAMTLWRQYISEEDVHRSFARFGSVENSLSAVIVGVILGILALRSLDLRAPLRTILVYGLAATVVALTGMAGEWLLGARSPFWLTGWMPQRLLNHVVVILLAASVGMIGRSGKPVAAYGVLVVMLGLLALRPVFAWFVPGEIFQRYFAAPEVVVFGLAGSAAAAIVLRSGLAAGLWVPTVAVAWVSLAWLHQFGAAGFGAGFALVGILSKSAGESVRLARAGVLLVALLCGVLSFSLTMDQWRSREHLPVTRFQQDVKSYLYEQGEPMAMLVTPHWWIGYQETTDHPVLYTYETPQFMSYMTSLCPSIVKLRRDLYGIRPGVPWDYSLDAWRARSPEEWVALGREYSFRYVLCPNWLKLPLQSCLSDEAQTMYRIE